MKTVPLLSRHTPAHIAFRAINKAHNAAIRKNRLQLEQLPTLSTTRTLIR